MFWMLDTLYTACCLLITRVESVASKWYNLCIPHICGFHLYIPVCYFSSDDCSEMHNLCVFVIFAMKTLPLNQTSLPLLHMASFLGCFSNFIKTRITSECAGGCAGGCREAHTLCSKCNQLMSAAFPRTSAWVDLFTATSIDRKMGKVQEKAHVCRWDYNVDIMLLLKNERQWWCNEHGFHCRTTNTCQSLI